MTLRQLARSVRHAPGLERMDFLWNAVRKPYYRLTTRHGVVMRLGGARVVFPQAHAQSAWEAYEPEAMRAFVGWLKQHPTGTVIDVGAAIGLYTHVALTVAPNAVVYAIDADAASLNATRVLAGPLCRLVWGFVADHNAAGGEGGVVTAAPHYTCIGDEGTDAIPTHTLDALFARARGPVLLKIDIEGAELLALVGATHLLARKDVTLLLSVHPQLLTRYNATVGDVAGFLTSHGYTVKLLAVDHEEHWRCERWAHHEMSDAECETS